jgi:hypothetical protein
MTPGSWKGLRSSPATLRSPCFAAARPALPCAGVRRGDCTLSAFAEGHRLTRVLDHLIVAGSDVVSLAERGAL